MVYNVYSIRDRLDGFMRPFVGSSDAFAKRDFAATVNGSRENSAVSFSPADFDLYRLGTFDTVSGVIEPEKVPVFVCKGSDLLADS